jgi:quaternary ammonium compound-resistance protein SugE
MVRSPFPAARISQISNSSTKAAQLSRRARFITFVGFLAFLAGCVAYAQLPISLPKRFCAPASIWSGTTASGGQIVSGLLLIFVAALILLVRYDTLGGNGPRVTSILADLIEIAWPFALKWSGKRRLWVAALIAATACLPVFLLPRESMKDLSAATTYASFVGIGTLGTAIVGSALFGERVNPARVGSFVPDRASADAAGGGAVGRL